MIAKPPPWAARLAVWSAAHARAVTAAVLLLTVLAGLFAARNFSINTDTRALIDRSVPWRLNETALNTAFPQNSEIIVIVVDGATPERAEAAAAALTAALQRRPDLFSNVRRPDGGPFFDRHGLLFLPEREVRAAVQGMVEAQPFLGPLAADPSLRGVARAVGTLSTGVERGDAKLAQLAPPLTAIDRALAQQAAGGATFFSWQDLFAGSGEGPPRRKLILALPKLDYTALMPGEAASETVRAQARRLGLTPANGVTVRQTGPVPLADEEFKSIEHNIGLVAALMVSLLIGTLALALRSKRTVLAVLISTIAGLVITAALGLAAVGRFTLISVAFIPLFVGIGVDFAIQFATRFREERMGGGAPLAAIERAGAKLGRSLVLAAGAVALGFCAFLPTDYVGISELGVIAGLGMVVALVLALTLLPALLALIPAPPPRRSLGNPAMAAVDHWLVEKRRLVLGAFAVSMVLSIAALPLVEFDFNPLNLRDPASESRATLSDLERDPERTPNIAEVLAPNLTAAEVIAARLRALPQVREAVTLSSLVPTDQGAKLAVIADANAILDVTLNPFETAALPTDRETQAALSETAAGLMRAAAADPAGAALARSLAAKLAALAAGPSQARANAANLLVPPLDVTLNQIRTALSAEPVTLNTLPPEIRRDWIAPDGKARIVTIPAGDVQDNANIAHFTAAVTRIAPAATGAPVTIQAAASTIAQAFVRAGVIAVAAISLLLWLVLRSVREVLFTLAPVVLSAFLTLATCVVIGQPINFANIIAFPLLFGVGVAFHIYFVIAWSDGVRGLLQTSLARAVFFSALATGTAFGSLILSTHPGTASMGLVLAISLVWTLVCALIFEPALLGPGQNEPNRSIVTV